MAERARVTVLAGVNGAGKSSVAGEWLRQRGGEYFNPDEVARRFREASPAMSTEEANGRAWEEGKKRLEAALRDRTDFAFETTLGGRTLTGLLFQALEEGLEVAVLYLGLESVDLHLARVRSRALAGGHDIPEPRVRARYTSSLQNLVRLAPRLTELRVLDNSFDADPKTGRRPQPREILYAKDGKLVRLCDPSQCPTWAKPIAAVLLKQAGE